MTKKLHELIEMAKAGKQFEARYQSFGYETYNWSEWYTHQSICACKHDFNAITAEWTVRMKREPRVIYVTRFSDGQLSTHYSIRPTVPEGCEPIKFIEVIE